MMTIKTSYQFDSGYFCAGIDVDREEVIRAAPILRWCIGKPVSAVLNYATAKGWKITEVPFPCE